MKEDIKKMTIEEIDKRIDSLPRIFMKAIYYTEIKKIRPDYIPKHLRKKE